MKNMKNAIRKEKKQENKKSLLMAMGFFLVFVIWTIGVCYVDRQAVGPRGSVVGFATVNSFFHHLTGVHLLLYTITDWLGLVPVGFGLGFAVLGLIQLIKRRNLFQVDFDILALGAFYLLVIAGYVFFEKVVINYRPILI